MFQKVLLFKLRTTYPPPKKKKIQFILCQLDVRRLPEVDFFAAVFYVVRSLKKRTSSKIVHVFFCIVQLKSILLMPCVFWIF